VRDERLLLAAHADAALGPHALHLHQQRALHHPADLPAPDHAPAAGRRADGGGAAEGREGRRRPARQGPRLTMARASPTAQRKNRLLGAAVVKAVLRKRTGNMDATSALYEGILRDLGVTDAQVEAYLVEHEE